MRSSDKLKPNLFDLIAVFAVSGLAIFCGVMFWSDPGQSQQAVVSVSFDAEKVQEISLSEASANETLTFTHNGITMTLTLNPDGQTGVAVTHSDCPGGDCVRTGVITRSGESIVCLPARTVITLQNGTDSGVDAVLG